MPISTLTQLNEAPPRAFVETLGQIVEHSPWVAEEIVNQRPFGSIDALWSAMIARISAAGPGRQDALFRLHPELAGSEATAGTMTQSSTTEQGRLGLTSLSRVDFERLSDLNLRYRERFGFPCIIALRLHAELASVLTTFGQRLGNDVAAERETTIGQIAEIVRGRIYLLLKPAGWLSTHVLDTASGLPAAGMRIDLFDMRPDGPRLIKFVETNTDGRTDDRMLTGGTMMPGKYRLAFHVGDHFRQVGSTAGVPPFLDIVPIDFGIFDPDVHLHVPLLCTPWSYMTYRGS